MTENISPDLLLLLDSAMNGNINEFSIDIKELDGKGECFVSDVFFVTLTRKKTNERHWLVVKQQKIYNSEPLPISTKTFDNEINFYYSIWPVLQNFYQDVTGKPIVILPKCLATGTGPIKKLALQNLIVEDFKIYDKTKPFDDEHFSFIFKTYGIYHAISMALKETNIEEFNKLANLLHLAAEDGFTNARKILTVISRRFQTFFELSDKHLKEKLQLYEESEGQLAQDSFEQATSHGVIIHGDCWSNNYIFKYDVRINLFNDFILIFAFLIYTW